MSLRSSVCWHKKEKLFFFLSKFIIFSFLKPEEQIWKFFTCNDISFCVLEYPQAWIWIRSAPYQAAVDCPQVYLSWKSEVSSCASNQIMEHTSCQKGERKRMKWCLVISWMGWSNTKPSRGRRRMWWCTGKHHITHPVMSLDKVLGRPCVGFVIRLSLLRWGPHPYSQYDWWNDIRN